MGADMTSQSNDHTFELIPEIYDQLVNWSRRLEREGPLFRQLFETHDVHRVLDLACGTGHHAQMFASWGHTVHGLDGSREMIDYCRRTHGESPTLQWSAARMETLPRFDASFDAIVCLGNSLSMLADAKAVEQVLRAAAERLRPGGIMITHTLNLGRLPDGPITWQKARRVAAGDVERFIVKGVHRSGDRGYIDVAEVPIGTVDDFTHCRSTPVLSLSGEDLANAFATAGLAEITLYGDHARSPFVASESANLIAVGKRSTT